jgi:Fe-S-cluster-containing hydrogenase component 2
MIASTFIYRPFCRYICPFGAIASLVGRFSPFKIRRTDACLDCGICEKICPTLEAYRESNKGECYLCYRCIEFCKNEMFIDTQKLSQIKRLLTTISMNYCIIEKEQLFDTIIKDIIRLFAPCERKRFLDKLLKAFKGKSIISINCIQRIVISLRELFPDETKEINSQKYKKWIDLNEIQWKQNFEDIYLNKIIYGLNS